MKIEEIVELIKKIHMSLIYTAPEAMEEKYVLLAEKYQDNFTNRHDISFEDF